MEEDKNKKEEIQDGKKEEIQKDLKEVGIKENAKITDGNSEKEKVSSKEKKSDSADKKTIKDGTDIFDDEEIDLSIEGSTQESKSGAGEEGETKKKEAKKDEKKQKKSKKAKKKKNKEIRKVSIGRAYIKASYNNTMITLTDNNGNVLITGSAGQLGFKGPKKSTPYASSIIVRDIINKVKSYGLQTVSVFVNGVGAGRESAVRALNANGLNILSIKDITPVPHNGCRAKKPRRV